ncbi:hypothetical protein E2C01_025563 [Portunus trituberculatus]|uniref:Uncharacterized protein n=1 Tax=Portunus trituberculatus TaxID=210409 RepID=A0A5B7EG96_PORTR|nr:hypothetical protein [Portunus trituberculatus]
MTPQNKEKPSCISLSSTMSLTRACQTPGTLHNTSYSPITPILTLASTIRQCLTVTAATTTTTRTSVFTTPPPTPSTTITTYNIPSPIIKQCHINQHTPSI